MPKENKLHANDYDPNAIDQPVPDYYKYMILLDLPHTLLGGTLAMRAAKTKYLPKEENERKKSYENRLKRTFLYNVFEETVTTLSGEVFSEPVTMPDDITEEVNVWSGDVDLSGHNLTRFAKNIFEDGAVDGVVHILVDLPEIESRIDPTNGQVQYFDPEAGEWKPLNLEAMNANGWRPYFVQIKSEQVIGWRHQNIEGNNVLIQLRIKEVTEEPDGIYGVKEVERIRVYEPGRWEVHELKEVEGKKEKEWIKIKEGVTGLDYIPLVTWMIGKPLSQMTAEPPLDDLAHLNLAHWQSSSDQRNILHYARMVVYFGKLLGLGINEQGKEEEVVLGANVLVHGKQPESDLKVVEPTGNAIESGRNDLKDLEMQMKQFGLSLMVSQPTGQITATEKALDTAKTNNKLLSWALSLADILTQAFSIAAQMMQVEDRALQKNGVTVNTDFKTFLQTQEMSVILESVNSGILPRQLAFNELKRRGVVKTELDFQEILAMIRQEDREEEI